MNQDTLELLGDNHGNIIANESVYEALENIAQGADGIKENEGISEMEAMTIDLRFNGGGQDAVSFEVLSRFIEGDHRVALEKLRCGNGFSPVLPIVVQGVMNGYGYPVYVLTSPKTGSAAEAFALATIPFSHNRRIGSSVMGATSAPLENKPPNGWSFSKSNEIYMELSGRS